jgi:hypothetical protein
MSSAVVFLLAALGVAAASSSILWYLSGRHRAQQPDYQTQMRAIAPRSGHGPVEQPRGIVPLDAIKDEEL